MKEKENENQDQENSNNNSNQNKILYKLYAVSIHLGGLDGGHYQAAAYSWPQDNWYFFDDSLVSLADPETIHSASSYLLFYQRIHESESQ